MDRVKKMNPHRDGSEVIAGYWAVDPTGTLVLARPSVTEDGLKTGWRWATESEVVEADALASKEGDDSKALEELRKKRAAVKWQVSAEPSVWK